MSGRVADYNFDLPEYLVADRPAARREDSRMMVLDRRAGTIRHHVFHEITGFVRPGDLFVLNDAKVIPARVFSDDGHVELLLLARLDAGRWTAMVKPGRKMRPGARIAVGGVPCRVEEILGDGLRLLVFDADPDLERVGVVPLPPYIRRRADLSDRERYQTVYARTPGAVAAPTAGLHFTPEILSSIPHEFLTLLVGAGTFKPVQCEVVSDHVMHRENFELPERTAEKVRAARRVVAVGTTVVRVLESVAATGSVSPCSGSTEIFIRPPHEFQCVDSLLTNFHLPKSTLLMLVSAFAGRDFVLEAYREAVRENYRFFSYGDCMLIQ